MDSVLASIISKRWCHQVILLEYQDPNSLHRLWEQYKAQLKRDVAKLKHQYIYLFLSYQSNYLLFNGPVHRMK